MAEDGTWFESLGTAGRRALSSPCSRGFQEQFLSSSRRDEPHWGGKDYLFWKRGSRKQIVRIEPHDCVGPIHPHADCPDGDVKAQSSQTAVNKDCWAFKIFSKVMN